MTRKAGKKFLLGEGFPEWLNPTQDGYKAIRLWNTADSLMLDETIVLPKFDIKESQKVKLWIERVG